MRLAAFVFVAAFVPVWASEGEAQGRFSVDTWKWINFAILGAGIGYLATKMGKPALRQRREEIVDEMRAAEDRGRAALEKAAEVERRITGLDAEVTRMKEAARAEMQGEAERIQAETAEQIAKVERLAQTEIAAAGKEAVAELRTQAAQIALRLAEQKIAVRMDPQTERQLAERFVEGLRGRETRN